ncbi:MAG: acyl-CoA dehydrogenase family protein [Actinomycetota bacterium]
MSTITESPAPNPSAPADERTWPERAAALAPQLAAYSADHDRSGTFVTEAFDLLRAEGFIGALVPTEFGGAGISHVEAGAVLTELAKGCPATAVTLSMHYHLVATQVWRHNAGQDAEGVLRKVADTDAILISTGASDWIDSNGTATKVEGGYQVTARKSPASGAPVGTILVTSVPWAEGPDGPSVIHCAVPFAAEGVSIDATWDTMGLRATGSHTVVLDDVFVPDAAVSLIRPAGQWHPVWNAVLGSAMPLIMSAYLGIAAAAAELATEAVAASVGIDDAAVAVQLDGLGRMGNQLTTASDLVAAMLASSDNLSFAPTLTHTATVLARKTEAAEAMIATVRSALDLYGGRGFTVAGGLERLYRDVHGALYHPLPAAKQRQFSARVALGLDPLG